MTGTSVGCRVSMVGLETGTSLTAGLNVGDIDENIGGRLGDSVSSGSIVVGSIVDDGSSSFEGLVVLLDTEGIVVAVGLSGVGGSLSIKVGVGGLEMTSNVGADDGLNGQSDWGGGSKLLFNT
jgi:hypothetical protein